jgi:hypothetical protein
MAEYVGHALLVDPRGNVVAEVDARLSSTSPSFTAVGAWGGELQATETQPDPFMDLMGIDGLAVRIGDREGVVLIKSCTAGGAVAQVVGSDDPPF